jgi:predicted nucleic acid-binding protein
VTPVFCDTSGFLALLVKTDAFHARARRAFETLRAREAPLLTTSYVLVETYALLGRRFGLDAVRAFRESMEPLLSVEWIGPDTHAEGLDWLLAQGRARLSLVDATSFVVARAAGVEEAFAFDPDFERAGFRLVR